MTVEVLPPIHLRGELGADPDPGYALVTEKCSKRWTSSPMLAGSR